MSRACRECVAKISINISPRAGMRVSSWWFLLLVNVASLSISLPKCFIFLLIWHGSKKPICWNVVGRRARFKKNHRLKKKLVCVEILWWWSSWDYESQVVTGWNCFWNFDSLSFKSNYLINSLHSQTYKNINILI